MDPERWRQIEQLFHSALELEVEHRAAFLAEAADSDEILKREVQALLEQPSCTDALLEKALGNIATARSDTGPAALAQNAELGPYRIEQHLGRGGMGEVYKARDTRLDRTVAIKVLTERCSQDRQLRERFDREARAASRLNHQHICALYDIGHQDGIDYLVMEYLEGETLACRLHKGPLPLNQALRFAIDISGALHEAHRHGVIHRDIKPDNIMLTKSGAKVLDFGVAKMRAKTTTDLTTVPTGLTEEGTILGTLQYMAPEQLEGKRVDARTDIFAFGAVLYEMITGKKAFTGETRASLIASILDHNPVPLAKLDSLTPAALDWALRKCLAKDPDKRWQSAQDLQDELSWIAETGYQTTVPAKPIPRLTKVERLLWPIVLVSLVGILGAAVVYFWQRPGQPDTVSFTIPPPEKATFEGPMAISPDGRRLALLISGADGIPLLWVRRLDSPAMQLLSGTEYANYPFWSPDSRFIAFFSRGELKKVAASGGPVQTLCYAPGGLRGTWNRDGVIVFPITSDGGLHRVSAEGGPISVVSIPDRSRHEASHRWPHFLPDGRHFLFTACTGNLQNESIHIGSLGSQESRLLLKNSWIAYYSPSARDREGNLFFFRDGKLKAQKFEPSHVALYGEPITVAETVAFDWRSEDAFFSVSGNGSIAYRPGPDSGSVSMAPWTSGARAQLIWYDRSGKQLGTLDALGQGVFPRLSPDGKRLALSCLDPQTGDFGIWLLQLARGSSSRLTFPATGNFSAVWSPDTSRIVFASGRNGFADLYQKSSSGEGNEELLLSSRQGKWPWDWSPDGRFISFTSDSISTKTDLWFLPLYGERKPILFRQTPANELGAMFSPDQKWIAYSSDESGRWEVYAESFDASLLTQPSAARRKWQVSTNGGFQPIWRRDGKELLYVSSDVSPRDWWSQRRPGGKLMAVDVKEGTSQFEVGIPRELFRARFPDQAAPITYAATADGQRFLINTLVAEETPITLVLNWRAD